jgi:hypothetical protein
MRALSAAQLLDVWERGSVQPPVDRALTLLEAACPGVEADDLARLSIGRRDALLLSLREAALGPHLTALANCPDCNDELELTFRVEDVRAQALEAETDRSLILSVEGYELHFRLPDSRDLAAITAMTDGAQARKELIERCLLSAHKNGARTAPSDVPELVLDAMEQEMARLDPQANIRLGLDCPGCGRSWTEDFDILAFLWREINALASRLLLEVHSLASQYGWREADILEMSAARRNLYMTLI